jgi:hypothetical protein
MFSFRGLMIQIMLAIIESVPLPRFVLHKFNPLINSNLDFPQLKCMSVASLGIFSIRSATFFSSLLRFRINSLTWLDSGWLWLWDFLNPLTATVGNTYYYQHYQAILVNCPALMSYVMSPAGVHRDREYAGRPSSPVQDSASPATRGSRLDVTHAVLPDDIPAPNQPSGTSHCLGRMGNVMMSLLSCLELSGYLLCHRTVTMCSR